MTTAPHTMPTVARDELARLLEQVDEEMHTFLAHEQIHRRTPDPRGALPVQEIATIVKAGGKRLRPVFCLSGYLAAGGMPSAEPVRAAVALELLHVGALIHDDVMDDSELRRGVPAIHTKHGAAHENRRWRGESRRYGEAIAILAGDLAWVYADHLMAGYGPEVSREWFDLRAELITGQSLDVMAAAEFAADPVLARHIAVLKSGRYSVHRPLVLGATIAGRPDLAPAFETYGEALGEAFQLRDDLIDAFGTADASGKPSGLDFAQHKMTLLIALAMKENDEIRALVERRAFDELRESIVTCGVLALVEDHIADLVRRARTAIGDAPISDEWLRELTELAITVAYRDA